MKFLSTRICSQCNVFPFTYDSEITPSSNNIELISLYYYDQYNMPINILDEYIEHFQPKSIQSFEFISKNFYPCILAVEDIDYEYWIKTKSFYPNQDIYNRANLIFLGYDIIDTCFISIKSHGISAEYERKLYLLNKFGLFNNCQLSVDYLHKNRKYIPEHDWRIVYIYTNLSTYLEYI